MLIGIAWISPLFMTIKEAEFSHGICPDCAKKLYPDYFKEEGLPR
ncbi:MAG: hypothetical protein ACHQ0Y_15030 [Thermodesulfovibrionales bacterium]